MLPNLDQKLFVTSVISETKSDKSTHEVWSYYNVHRRQFRAAWHKQNWKKQEKT